jgi:hypothetical protein
MLLDVLVYGEVPLKLLHGLKMKKEEDHRGPDLFLKIMPNMDLVNLPQEELEELSYIMIAKMLFTFPESLLISQKHYNSGVTTSKVLKNVNKYMKNVRQELKP